MMPLPVDTILANLKQALRDSPNVVLQAPPGAGKTTRVPPALLTECWLAGKRLILLEPRRMAARRAADYMARQMGQEVGQTVGYRVRLDSRVGPETRIEVVTEGVLTRLLQRDPALEGVGAVIFDEFHERSLDGDLALALCLDLQAALNQALRLLVMSATLEAAPLGRLLGGAPLIGCRGRIWPVETVYLPPRPGLSIERATAAAVQRAARREAGSILAFLSGAAEIRRVARLLQDAGPGPGWEIHPLYGGLPRAAQDRAVEPAPAGRRKVVLATNIAETSLTIEGVRVVVDSGFCRQAQVDVASGMTRLVTRRISRAAAEQRRGRAGRSEPGVCYRLWSPETDASLAAFSPPEILEADLAGLALELAVWGVAAPGELSWLDPPPAAAFAQARELLDALGALDAGGRVTAHGRAMSQLPLHPRLAHMLLMAAAQGQGSLAALLAAILSERDPLHFPPGQGDSDLQLRVDALEALAAGRPLPGPALDPAAGRQILRAAAQLRRRLKLGAGRSGGRDLGRLLAWAYPERVARRRPGCAGRFLMVCGRGAVFDAAEPLAAADYVVAAHLDGDRREARVFLAAGYDVVTLEDQFGDRIRRCQEISWDPGRQAVTVRETTRLGALVLASRPLATPDAGRVQAALLAGIRQSGLGCLPWTPALQRWRQRVLFAGRLAAGQGGRWPDFSDEALLENLAHWLGPSLGGLLRLKDLTPAALKQALEGLLDWEQRRRLDFLAPTHLTVPSGSRLPLDYGQDPPVLAVRIQEVFGASVTPAVAGGRVPVVLHLLSPAGRPLQVTRDLAHFWQNAYQAVKREMRGRYPRHPWPDDPLQAPATRRAKPRKAH
ncbi:MAG: ATP-dependent helicase HrpB [Desulfobacteraceae bacterium]|nr:ATP-dependent helicase HrpB [Desulfobacteraceae bacterium]